MLQVPWEGVAVTCACILAGEPQVSTPTGAMGYTTASGAFCGHTMLQHHPSREDLPVFAHRNLLKWSANLDLHTPSWTAVKRGSLDVSVGRVQSLFHLDLFWL